MFRRLIHIRRHHNHKKNTYSYNLLCKKIGENQMNKMAKLHMENEKLKKKITKIDDDLDTLNLALICLVGPMAIYACFK
jgi:cell division protein FtsB